MAKKKLKTVKRDFILATISYKAVENETCWSVERAHLAGLDNFMWIPVGGDALIGRSRSMFLTIYLLDDDMPPYLIWLDSDIVFNPEDLHRIAGHLRAGYDLIGGDYAVKAAIQSANYGINGELDYDGKVHEIKWLSTGFMGVSKKMVADIQKKLNLPLLHQGEHCECYPFFESGYRKLDSPTNKGQTEVYISEDWDFCDKAAKCGYKPYLDTSVRLGHKGTKIITIEECIQHQLGMQEKEQSTIDYVEQTTEGCDASS